MQYRLKLADLRDLPGWLEAHPHVREEWQTECKALRESRYWQTMKDLEALETYRSEDLTAWAFLQLIEQYADEAEERENGTEGK